MSYFVSVTRAKVRSLLFLPGFAREALRSTAQARNARGFRGGELKPDRRWTFWTLTVWDSEADMRAYMTSGDHRKAMPKFVTWCDEASVAHWTQATASIPSWAEIDRRMRAEGRPSKLRHPSRFQADMSFPPPSAGGGGPISPNGRAA